MQQRAERIVFFMMLVERCLVLSGCLCFLREFSRLVSTVLRSVVRVKRLIVLGRAGMGMGVFRVVLRVRGVIGLFCGMVRVLTFCFRAVSVTGRMLF